jgi:hypothetical protein
MHFLRCTSTEACICFLRFLPALVAEKRHFPISSRDSAVAEVANDVRQAYSPVMPCRQQCIAIQKCLVAQSHTEVCSSAEYGYSRGSPSPLPPSPPLTLPLTLHTPAADVAHRWKPARRTGGDDAPHSRSATDENSVARVNRGGGGQGMSRLDAVVRVLKSTGRPLHYDVITRQALQLVRKKKKMLAQSARACFEELLRFLFAPFSKNSC